MGHPPFGHAGEQALNKVLLDSGSLEGFEGNAQTFRIVSKLGESGIKKGFNFTRRALLGVIKYPVFYKQVKNNTYMGNPPKSLYNSEIDIFDWIFNKISKKDKSLFTTTNKTKDKHLKSLYKSLDASIMEKADDIAYAIHDFEDSIELGLISKSFFEREILNKILLNKHIQFLDQHIKHSLLHNNSFSDVMVNQLFSKDKSDRKFIISLLIYFFIHGIKVEKANKFSEVVLDYNIKFEDYIFDEILNIFKSDIVYNQVISNQRHKILSFKYQTIITKLFKLFKDNPSELLPESTFNKYRKSNDNLRIISDHIAGMTDSYAIKIYRKITEPSYGSQFDLI